MVLSRFYFAKKEMLNFTKKADKRGTLSFCQSVSKRKYVPIKHHLIQPLSQEVGGLLVWYVLNCRAVPHLNYREMDV